MGKKKTRARGEVGGEENKRSDTLRRIRGAKEERKATTERNGTRLEGHEDTYEERTTQP